MNNFKLGYAVYYEDFEYKNEILDYPIFCIVKVFENVDRAKQCVQETKDMLEDKTKSNRLYKEQYNEPDIGPTYILVDPKVPYECYLGIMKVELDNEK